LAGSGCCKYGVIKKNTYYKYGKEDKYFFHGF
jgi:hypothetical protein